MALQLRPTQMMIAGKGFSGNVGFASLCRPMRIHKVCSRGLPVLRYRLGDIQDTETKTGRDVRYEEAADAAQERLEKIVEYIKEAFQRPKTVSYVVASVVVIYFSSAIIDGVERLPLIPGLLKLTGVFVTGWFAYKYLLFKESREDLRELLAYLDQKFFGEGDGDLADQGSRLGKALDLDTENTGGPAKSRAVRNEPSVPLPTAIAKDLESYATSTGQKLKKPNPPQEG